MISKDHLTKRRDLAHYFPIWQHLEVRFNTTSLARAMDLKRMLINLANPESQSINGEVSSWSQIYC